MVSKKNYSYIFIIILFFLIPPFLNTHFYIKDFNYNFLYVTSLIFGVLMAFVVIINLFSKNNYLKMVFGCHSKKCRSFNFIHKHLKLCARCFGILIGIFIAPLLSMIEMNYLYLIFLSIPLIIDGVIQAYSSYESNNLKRIITGIMFGVSLIVIFSYFYLYQAKLVVIIINKLGGTI